VPARASASPFRPEIQGLRAVAVVSVVLFHIWPGLVPGGYVGVDVFFVISGFFITGMLFREAEATGSISLVGFYERRVRRLLPAANLVLVAVALATPLLPPARWKDTAWEIAASALYAENWRLSWLAVDYLGAENVASPVQHYWSLSIEEQFYIVWPLLLLVLAIFARRTGSGLRRVAFAGLAGVGLASFAASVLVTHRSPETAYFVTHTRVWELALGGLLALTPPPRWTAGVHEALRAVGLVAITVACFAFSGETAFPGYAAVLPTLGTALVILAGDQRPGVSSYRLLTHRPALYVGDISYSLYLWHWPAIVFYGALIDRQRSPAGGLALAAGCLAVSGLSKRFVEDPFRHRRIGSGPSIRAVGWGGVSIATCVLAAVALLGVVRLQRSVVEPLAGDPRYPGLAALQDGAVVPTGVTPYPPLALALDDKAEVYDNGCHVPNRSAELHPCHYGDPDAAFRIVLVGDSHAANWIPALAAVAQKRGWSLTTHTKSACPLLLRPIADHGRRYDTCLEWGQRVLEDLRSSPPDVVVLAQSAGARLWSTDGRRSSRRAMSDAIVDVWRELETTGTRVVALLDTPRFPFEPLDCVARRPDCAAPADEIFRADPIRRAHERMPSVAVVDMRDTLCRDGTCPIVIGNLVAWRDRHHLTATYARRLGPALASRIEAALRPGTHS